MLLVYSPPSKRAFPGKTCSLRRFEPVALLCYRTNFRELRPGR